ncbi:hypothetical protein [Streptomyces sp. NPDC060198]|uniref:hypothetical protein n=1 Tax=Streptomyces sp. NPDC060198 TaxID=3347070 RepID=UPI003659CDEA
MCCESEPDGATPDGAAPTEVRQAPAAADCSVCQDFDWAEREAERVGDPSGATDWRILRRRHRAAEHPEPTAGIASADSRTAPTD